MVKKFATPEKNSGRNVTVPGMSISPKVAVQRMANGTLANNLRGVYDNPDLEMPDISRMSITDRLHLQEKYRLQKDELTRQLRAAAKRRDEIPEFNNTKTD